VPTRSYILREVCIKGFIHSPKGTVGILVMRAPIRGWRGTPQSARKKDRKSESRRYDRIRPVNKIVTAAVSPKKKIEDALRTVRPPQAQDKRHGRRTSHREKAVFPGSRGSWRWKQLVKEALDNDSLVHRNFHSAASSRRDVVYSGPIQHEDRICLTTFFPKPYFDRFIDTGGHPRHRQGGCGISRLFGDVEFPVSG